MKGLTAKQRMILDFIVAAIKKDFIPPSWRDIGAHMGIKSTNGVNDHLLALARKGYINLENHKKRRLLMTEKTRKEYGLYFLGVMGEGEHGWMVRFKRKEDDSSQNFIFDEYEEARAFYSAMLAKSKKAYLCRIVERHLGQE